MLAPVAPLTTTQHISGGGEQGFMADAEWERLSPYKKKRFLLREEDSRVCQALARWARTCRWWRTQLSPLLREKRKQYSQTVLRIKTRLEKLTATHDRVLERSATARRELTASNASNAELRKANEELQAQAVRDAEELRIKERAIRVSNRDKNQRVSGRQKSVATLTESSEAGLFLQRGKMRPEHRDNIAKQAVTYL